MGFLTAHQTGPCYFSTVTSIGPATSFPTHAKMTMFLRESKSIGTHDVSKIQQRALIRSFSAGNNPAIHTLLYASACNVGQLYFETVENCPKDC